jgi:hypothetical protein
VPVISARRIVNRMIVLQADPGINGGPYWKTNERERSGAMAQMGECMADKCNTLSSKFSKTKKKKLN